MSSIIIVVVYAVLLLPALHLRRRRDSNPQCVAYHTSLFTRHLPATGLPGGCNRRHVRLTTPYLCFAEQVTRLPFSLRLQVARLIWLRRALDVVYGFRQRTASLGLPYFFLRRRFDSLNFSSTFSTSIIIHRPY